MASFAGDLSNKLSVNSGDLVLSQDSSTTTLVSSTNPSVFGQSVTFTATVAAVAPGTGTPTGTVTFNDGTTTLGTGTLNGSGVATFSTSTLTVGTHSITAVYGGDTNFTTSTSTRRLPGGEPGEHDDHGGLECQPQRVGQSVTFTATVAAVSPGAGTPTGTVTFKDGTTTLGTGTLNGSGVATFSTSTLAVGTHSITAVYGGDTNFTTSTSSAVSQVVNQASTTTTLASSANPTVFGQSVTFTATVTAVSPGAGTPTGTVTFLDGATHARHRHPERLGRGDLQHQHSDGGHALDHGGLRRRHELHDQHLDAPSPRWSTRRARRARAGLERQPERFRPVGDVHGDGRGRLAGRGHADGHGDLPGRRARTLGTGTLNGSGEATFSTSSAVGRRRTRSRRSTAATRTSRPAPRRPCPRW